jgi:PAS domain-containing protein
LSPDFNTFPHLTVSRLRQPPTDCLPSAPTNTAGAKEQVPPVTKSQPPTSSGTPHSFSQLTAIAPQPNRNEELPVVRDDRSVVITGNGNGVEKKQQKRAANRRSAQLSRKRKKAFIEELKEENDDLRRKEQILMSIPDLVVVFDSSGKLWFVSQSVCRFLDFTATELEGTSFWNRLCDDSVRLLKAAFMDSLAARSVDSDTAPLGAGFWELRLVDRDGASKIVTLNGVVHFAGDRPECVCSIRPHEGSKVSQKNDGNTSATGEASSTGSLYRTLIRVKPQQSVVSNVSSDSVTSSRRRNNRGPDAVRISDSGNSSSSSDGETNINA